MQPKLLLLLFPALSLASIEVGLKVVVQENKFTTSEAYPKGFAEREITDQDKTTLSIPDDSVKDAIERIHGKRPDEVYVTSNTPYENLHKRYGFKPVHVRVTLLKQNIQASFNSSYKKISSTKYENPNKKSKDTFIYEIGNLTKTVVSVWNEQKMSDVKTKITLILQTDDNLVEYDNWFPFGSYHVYTDDTYYEANRTIRLDAGQKVTAELEATHALLRVELPYEMTLAGDVVAKYDEMYKDKYFHTFDINDVLKNMNINTTIIIHQHLQYDNLYDAKLHMRDSNDIILTNIDTESKAAKKGARTAAKTHEEKSEGVPITTKKVELKVLEDENIEIVQMQDEESKKQEDKQVVDSRRNELLFYVSTI